MLLLLSCGAGEGATDLAADLSRGAEVIAPLKSELQSALRAGLSHGPVEAISTCQVEAPRIAASLSIDGIEMGRTSHRLRNPANAPRDWVAPLLDAFVTGQAVAAPRAIRLSAERIGYVEPIRAQAVCLACHGEQIAAPVAARIEALYPEDRAVGFAEGDLRGLFWAEFPAP